MKKHSFLTGAVVLAICAFVCKLLGAIYRIPLTNILGAQGMGIYYLVFPIYSFMLTISSSSFPMAISHIVAKAEAVGDKQKSKDILKASFVVLMGLGVICTLIVVCLSKIIASLQSHKVAYLGYYAIAPSILFVAGIACFRGYFQGKQNMFPSGISQIIEQFTKLLFGLFLSFKLSSYGVIYGVVGALLGITISEAIAFVYILVRYVIFSKKHLTKTTQNSTCQNYNFKLLCKELLSTTMPYMLGSIIYPLSVMIDSFLIINLLIKSGVSNTLATSLFGINGAVVGTLMNLPTVVSIALSSAIVPSITSLQYKGDFDKVKSRATFCVKITIIVSLACCAIFTFFAKPIVDLLFSKGLSNQIFNEFQVAYGLLSISGVGVVYLCLLQVFSAILQALEKPYLPVISLSVGVVVKIICEVIFILNPNFNIYGAVLSNTICYLTVCILNALFLLKYVEIKLGLFDMLFCPILCVALMCASVFVCDKILVLFLPKALSTITSFVVGTIIYVAGLVELNVISKSELRQISSFKNIKSSLKK